MRLIQFPRQFHLLQFTIACLAAWFASHPVHAEVVINEIHYNPEQRGPSLEFIELYNNSEDSVDLSYWHIDDAVEFAFAKGTTIAGGEFIVVAAKPEKRSKHTGTNRRMAHGVAN